MYQEELKRAFISYYETLSDKNNIGRDIELIFESSETYENKFNKDLYDFNVDQISVFLSSKMSRSYLYLANIVSILKKYGSYCINRNLVADNQNHFDEFTKDMIVNCLNQYVLVDGIITREKLIEYLNSEDDIPNFRDKFIMIAIFEGIGGSFLEELRLLKKTDIHENSVYLCTNREISVTDELIQFARKAMEEESVYKINETPSINADARKYNLIDSEYVVKSRVNAESEIVTYSTIKMMLMSYCKKLQTQAFTIHSLRMSGIINMGRSLMSANGISDPAGLYNNQELSDQIFDKYGTFRTDTHLLQYENHYL